MNTKLQFACDGRGRPISLFIDAEQVSDYVGAPALGPNLLEGNWVLGKRGYNADWPREA